MKNYVCTVLISLIYLAGTNAQIPQPCGPVPIMSPDCAGACVICDIDGFTGTNNIQSNDGGFPEFCSFPDNMHYIAFIAGSTSLKIRISVDNCNSGFAALDIGFYQSLDCINYTSITSCFDDLEGGQSFEFTTQVPLVIGQHYYLVMDGSSGSVCSWTFDVTEGSTAVTPLVPSVLPQLPEICANQEFTITNTPQVGATLFDWNIDGLNTSTQSEFSHIIPEAGTYQLCYKEANSCNEATPICAPFTVLAQVQKTTFLVICEGDSIDFKGTIYSIPGTYENILVPASTGCDTVVTLVLDFGSVFEGDDFYNICDGDTLSLDGQQHFSTGVYDHFLLTDKGCDSTVHVNLDLVLCNMKGAIIPQDLQCNGDISTGAMTFSVTVGTPPFNYSWVKIFEEASVFGTGRLDDDGKDVTISGLNQGSYLVTVEDEFGNFTILTTEILEPTPLQSQISAQDYNGYNISCNGLQDGIIELSATGGVPNYDFLWSNGDAGSPSISNVPVGLYRVSITDDSGCVKTDSITLTEPLTLTTAVESNNPDCEGPLTGNLGVTATTGGTPDYTYSLDESPFTSTKQYTALPESIYNLTTQDANGCTYTNEVTLVAALIPEIDFAEDLTINLGDSIQLFPLPGVVAIDSAQWSSAEGLDCQNCLTPTAKPFNTTTFNLEVFSIDGCAANSNIVITVDKDRSIYSPNIFDPTTDGVDQLFSVMGGSQVSIIKSLKVYDRWGNMVFEKFDLNKASNENGWNGRIGNQELSTGVYVWQAEIEFLDGVIEIKAGNVMLIR